MNIWPLRKKKTLEESGFFSGLCDWHSHILPGVDDGVKTIEESLSILEVYEKAGVETIWLTPHIMEDMPNTTTGLRDRFAELSEAYRGNIHLHLAAEYMLDNLFEERLESVDLLPLGTEGQHLLVETSCYNPPMNLSGILERIKAKGYFPVLAHPERYQYMDRKQYDSLKSKGILFQLNLPSVFGYYGPGTKAKAVSMLKKGYYSYIGCDLHRLHTFEKLYELKIDNDIISLLHNIKNI